MTKEKFIQYFSLLPFLLKQQKGREGKGREKRLQRYTDKQNGEPCPYLLQQMTPTLGSKHSKPSVCSDSSGCEAHTLLWWIPPSPFLRLEGKHNYAHWQKRNTKTFSLLLLSRYLKIFLRDYRDLSSGWESKRVFTSRASSILLSITSETLIGTQHSTH